MEWLTWAVIAVFVGWVFFQTVRVVPQREVFVVERLGKYYKSLEAGFHILIPFIDKVSYKHTMKEQTIDVPSQSCITADNIAVEIDGILYLQVQEQRFGYPQPMKMVTLRHVHLMSRPSNYQLSMPELMPIL